MKNIRIALCLITVTIQATISAQHATDARQLALGHILSTITDQWSVFANPAGLPLTEGIHLTSAYTDHYFISELDQKQMGFSFSRNGKALGVSLFNSGDRRMVRNQIGIIYAQDFTNRFSIGIKADYLSLSLAEPYGSKGTFFAELGVQSRVTKSLEFGFHLYNPTRQVVAISQKERLPTVIFSGLRYHFSKIFSLRTEIEKSSRNPYNLKFASEYILNSRLRINLGFEGLYRRYCFGLGLFLRKQLEIQMALAYEPVLGFNSALSFSMRLDKQKQKD